MLSTSLKYGSSAFELEIGPQFEILGGAFTDERALSDAEIGERLDAPVDSQRLEDIVATGETVLVVVPDATRRAGSGQIVNLLVRRLIANGTPPSAISIIFATGIHRQVTEDEKAEILTPFILQRIKTLEHDARDLATLIKVGETSGGNPVELNRAVLENDHVIIVGGISFHYFAGFAGGRKLICPGLGSARTIAATHKLAFDCHTKRRREGVDTGILDGNAVHEAFMECVRLAPPSFAVSAITDSSGAITDVFCGDWESSHARACKAFAATHTITITEPRELVIASCGGFPSDINMIQAHKTLDTASRACIEGGTIVLLAECRDGLGRSDFLDWFDADSASELAERLCAKYQVNGQTAWNLLRIAESHDVRILTDLDGAVTTKMRLNKIDVRGLSDLIAKKGAPGYVMAQGAKFHVTTRPTST